MKEENNRSNKNSYNAIQSQCNKGKNATTAKNLIKQTHIDKRKIKTKNAIKGEKMRPIYMNEIDDLDQMLLHEDFGHYLFLASQLKQIQQYLINQQPLAIGDSFIIDNIMNNINYFDPENQRIKITKQKILDKLCNHKRQSIPTTFTLKNGLFPQTDSLMNESINTMKKEIRNCYDEIKKDEKDDKDNKPIAKKIKTEKGASPAQQPIAVKYSKHQTDILTNWMIQHREHPFPDSSEVKKLAKQTNLTHNQVVNWTTNVRKRNMKATIEGGKKPHHFLDFLFLAQDKERKKACQYQQQNNSSSLSNNKSAKINYNPCEPKRSQKVKSKSSRKKGKKSKAENTNTSPSSSHTSYSNGSKISMPSSTQIFSQNEANPNRNQMLSYDNFAQLPPPLQAPTKMPLFASNSSFSSRDSAFTAYTAPVFMSTESNINNPVVTPVYMQQSLDMNPLYNYSQEAYGSRRTRMPSCNRTQYNSMNIDQEPELSTYFEAPPIPLIYPIFPAQQQLQQQPNASSWDAVVRTVKSPDISTNGRKRSRTYSFDDNNDNLMYNLDEVSRSNNNSPDQFLKNLGLGDILSTNDSLCFESKKKQAIDLFWDLTSFTFDDETDITASSQTSNIEKLNSATTHNFKKKCNNLLHDLKSNMVTTTTAIKLDEKITAATTTASPSIVNNLTFEEKETPKAPDAPSKKRNSLDYYLNGTFLKDLHDDDLFF